MIKIDYSIRGRIPALYEFSKTFPTFELPCFLAAEQPKNTGRTIRDILASIMGGGRCCSIATTLFGKIHKLADSPQSLEELLIRSEKFNYQNLINRINRREIIIFISHDPIRNFTRYIFIGSKRMINLNSLENEFFILKIFSKGYNEFLEEEKLKERRRVINSLPKCEIFHSSFVVPKDEVLAECLSIPKFFDGVRIILFLASDNRIYKALDLRKQSLYTSSSTNSVYTTISKFLEVSKEGDQLSIYSLEDFPSNSIEETLHSNSIEETLHSNSIEETLHSNSIEETLLLSSEDGSDSSHFEENFLVPFENFLLLSEIKRVKNTILQYRSKEIEVLTLLE